MLDYQGISDSERAYIEGLFKRSLKRSQIRNKDHKEGFGLLSIFSDMFTHLFSE